MDHLDKVTGSLVSNPLAARLAVALGGDVLEDVLDERPGLLVSTGHDRGTVAGTLLATRNTGTNEADSLGSQVAGATVAVGEVRVATIDDDVTLLEEREERGNEVVNGRSGLDKEHDSAGRLELRAELLKRLGAHDGLAWGPWFSENGSDGTAWLRTLGLVLEESVNLGGGSVVSDNLETPID